MKDDKKMFDYLFLDIDVWVLFFSNNMLFVLCVIKCCFDEMCIDFDKVDVCELVYVIL